MGILSGQIYKSVGLSCIEEGLLCPDAPGTPSRAIVHARTVLGMTILNLFTGPETMRCIETPKTI